MAIQIQLRRGTTYENSYFTGAPGEITMDTEQKNFRIHDGSTQGGWKVDKADDVVHKADFEVITGTKRFVENIHIHSYDIDPSVAPSNTLYTSCIIGTDKAGNAISYNSAYQTASNGIGNRMCVTREVDGVRKYGEIQVEMNTTGGVLCRLPTDTYGTNFHGTADYAKWADLAENYQSDEKYPVGTLIKFGGEKDITIAHFGENCNGVISDKPGFVLDSELEDSQPVALVGKTPVRVIGKVNKFDKLVLSPISGVAKVKASGDEKVIAIALEASDNEEEKLIKCVTKFNLD